jgi:hypothetical protein
MIPNALECSCCKTIQHIAEIEMPEKGGAPVLWCPECLKQRQADAQRQQERVQLQHELIHTAIDTWKEDPELLWVSLGTRLLRWHLEK